MHLFGSALPAALHSAKTKIVTAMYAVITAITILTPLLFFYCFNVFLIQLLYAFKLLFIKNCTALIHELLNKEKHYFDLTAFVHLHHPISMSYDASTEYLLHLRHIRTRIAAV